MRLVSSFLAKNSRIIIDLNILTKGPKYPNSPKYSTLKIYKELRPITYNTKGRL